MEGDRVQAKKMAYVSKRGRLGMASEACCASVCQACRGEGMKRWDQGGEGEPVPVVLQSVDYPGKKSKSLE